MIKTYKRFISEKLTAVSTDKPSIAASINDLNQLEQDIKDFKNKRSQLESIYMTSENEQDLISKLARSRFINPVNNKSQMVFSNKLLQKYASVCDFKKQAMNKSKDVEKLNKDISEKESTISSNPTQKEGILDEIKNKKVEIEKLQKDIKNLSDEADRMERLTMDELQSLEQEIKKGSVDIKKGRSLT